MEWTTERQKLDNDLWRQVVKEKKLTTIYRRFATHKKMVEFSNEQYPYPYRRNSILALLVQSEDLDLIKRFWKHYFDKNNEDVKNAELEFLNGTNQIGQYMNYHYFRDAMPEEVLRQEAAFLGKEYEPQPRPENAERRWAIYEFLKARRTDLALRQSLQVEVSDYNVVYNKEHDNLTDEVMLDSFAVWRSETKMFGDLLLLNRDHKFGEQVAVDLESSEPLAQQVFKQLDWADKFFWAGELLPKWEQRLKNLNDMERKMAMYFTQKHGLIVLNEEKSAGNGNLKDNVQAAAYMDVSYQNLLLMGFNSKSFASQNEMLWKRALPHELAHGVDLNEEDRKKAFSDTDFMKMVGMWMYASEHPWVKWINTAYKQEDWLCELTAEIMGKTDHNVPLLNKVRQVFGRYTQMALENDTEGMKLFDDAVRHKWSNRYGDWQKTYNKMDKTLQIQNREPESGWDVFSEQWAAAYRDFYRSYVQVCRSNGKLEKMIGAVADDILIGAKAKPEKSADMLKLWCKKIVKELYGR